MNYLVYFQKDIKSIYLCDITLILCYDVMINTEIIIRLTLLYFVSFHTYTFFYYIINKIFF